MKVKVDSVETKLTKTGKPFYVVGVAGKKINYFDGKVTALLGKVCEVEFGEKNGYTTIEMITECLDLPEREALQPIPAPLQAVQSTENASMKFRAKALRLAIESAKLANISADKATSDNMLAVSEKYFNYITNGSHSE